MIRTLRALTQFAAVVLVTGSLAATSVVVVSDDTLVEQSDLILRGVVQAVAPAPATARTQYVVSVDKVLKGPALSTIRMNVIGGTTSNGYSLQVFGAPRLQPGEETLLFLTRAADGTYRPLHLMLGVFRLVGTQSRGYAVRDLSEVAVIRMANVDSPDERLLRNREEFEQWIEATVSGEHVSADYWRVPSPYLAIWEPFTLFESPASGKNIRWFAFDEGSSVEWFIQVAGFDGASPSIAQLQNAVMIWNTAPGTLIRYLAAGTTDATGGLSEFDGVNAVIFGDPNDEVDEAFSCSLGGVLAIGGPWFGSSTFPFKERVVHKAAGADVVYNNGVECIAQNATALKDFEEVLGHELGHTLGIAHSCGDGSSGDCQSGTPQDGALMRANAHLDGRGPQLNADDIAAAVELYPAPVTFPTAGRKRAVRRP